MTQQQHLHAQKVQRRLRYTAKNAQAAAVRLKKQKVDINTMSLSYGARLLLEGELKNYTRRTAENNTNGREWTDEQKYYWLGISKRSPKTYRYMRQTLTLPCEKTLKNTLDGIKIQPGVCKT